MDKGNPLIWSDGNLEWGIWILEKNLPPPSKTMSLVTFSSYMQIILEIDWVKLN